MTIGVVKAEMEKVLARLAEDFRTLRPGRASAELVNDLPVEAYGGKMPLVQVASISNNDQGQLIVQVWDKTVLAAAEKAIRDSQLGFAVSNDGSTLRLNLPPLSEERRQELAKLARQKAEAARIELRQARSEAHQQATRAKTAGEMREDELNRFTKELNDLIDKFNQEVKLLSEQKEQELLKV